MCSLNPNWNAKVTGFTVDLYFALFHGGTQKEKKQVLRRAARETSPYYSYFYPHNLSRRYLDIPIMTLHPLLHIKVMCDIKLAPSLKSQHLLRL